ncbi:MAG: MotA/TolQ/ExbB proton channel family protein [Bacteroidota bacterium]|jgi:biopolymer transport protein ExbB
MSIFLQTTPPDGLTVETSLNIIELLMKGGWVMYPLFLLSIIVIVIAIERMIYFGKQGVSKTAGFQEFLGAMSQKNYNRAMTICEENNSAWARVFQFATLENKSSAEKEKLQESAANVEVARLEKRLNILSMVASIAPLLGFIGTIAGVIVIFFDISTTTDISIGTISEGLYQKMISSAAGLVVGILAYLSHHLLQNEVDKFIAQIEEFDLQLKANSIQE